MSGCDNKLSDATDTDTKPVETVTTDAKFFAALERRQKHAEEDLKFWTEEHVNVGDFYSYEIRLRARATLGEIKNLLSKLRRPETVTAPTTNQPNQP